MKALWPLDGYQIMQTVVREMEAQGAGKMELKVIAQSGEEFVFEDNLPRAVPNDQVYIELKGNYKEFNAFWERYRNLEKQAEIEKREKEEEKRWIEGIARRLRRHEGE